MEVFLSTELGHHLFFILMDGIAYGILSVGAQVFLSSVRL